MRTCLNSVCVLVMLFWGAFPLYANTGKINLNRFDNKHYNTRTDSSIGGQTVLMNNSKELLQFHYIDQFGEAVNFNIPAGKSYRFLLQKDEIIYRATKYYNFYLVHPGDSLMITVDSLDMAKFSTGHTERDSELDFTRQMNHHMTLTFWVMFQNRVKYTHTNYQKLDSLFQEEYRQSMNFFHEYTKQHFVSTSFQEFLQKNFLVHLYGSELTFIGCQSKAKLQPEFTKYLLSLQKSFIYEPIMQEEWFSRPQYAFVKYRFHELINSPNYFDSLYHFIQENVHEETKKLVLFYVVKDELEKNAQSSKWFIRDYLKSYPETPFSQYIISKKENNQLLSTGGGIDQMISSNKKWISYKEMLESLRGNVVYIDLWASWCAPCRYEMPFSRKIRTLYQGKPIQFVYISVDEQMSLWLKANEQEQLSQTEFSFMMPDFTHSSLMKLLPNGSIPRYLLFDKKGKLVQIDAARPSEKELINQLDSLIRQ